MDDAELVRNLCPTDDGDERTNGIAQETTKGLDLSLDESARSARQRLGWAHHRGMATMRDTKSVIDVGVESRDQLAGER